MEGHIRRIDSPGRERVDETPSTRQQPTFYRLRAETAGEKTQELSTGECSRTPSSGPAANPTAKCRVPTGPPATERHANIRRCDDVSEVPMNRRRLAGRPTAEGKAGDGGPTRNHDNKIPERRHAPSPSGKPATHGTPSQPRFGTFRSGEPPSQYRIPRKTEGHNKNSNHE